MRYILITLLLSLPLISSAQLSHNDTACVRMRNLAEKDMYNKELKYYTFGLIPDTTLPFGNEISTLLKEKYNLQVISMGCIMDGYAICYNKQVEQIAHRLIPKRQVEDHSRPVPPPTQLH